MLSSCLSARVYRKGTKCTLEGRLRRSTSRAQSLVLIGSELVRANNYLQLGPPLCMIDVMGARAGHETMCMGGGDVAQLVERRTGTPLT